MDNSSKDKEISKRAVTYSRVKRRVLGHIWLVRVALLVLLFLGFGTIGFFTYRVLASSTIGQYIGLARDFVFPTTANLPISDGRVNILLMGKGGAGNDAPDLTDTMILASVSTGAKKITLISIPRDIWMDDLKAKINASYYYGNQKKTGGGLILAKSTVEEVVGTHIDYGVLVDLSGLRQVVDALGGIQVDVKTGFTDSQYPVVGHEADPCFKCRYQTVSFKPGIQFMNGVTAEEFVRSRHGDNNEGDDIHREVRQQLVIRAIMTKVLTPQVLTSPTKINELNSIANHNLETDLTLSREATIGRFVVDGRNNLKSYTIPDNLLFNPPQTARYLNQFVFVPRRGITDWSDVQKWVQTVLP